MTDRGRWLFAAVALAIGGGALAFTLSSRQPPDPRDWHFVRLSDGEAVASVYVGTEHQLRRVRLAPDGHLEEVWSHPIDFEGMTSEWTVVGRYLVGPAATANPPERTRTQLIAIRLSDGRELGRLGVTAVAEFPPRWDWRALDGESVAVRDGEDMTLSAVTDAGFVETWRAPAGRAMGVTATHLIVDDDPVRSIARADGRAVDLPRDESARSRVAVVAASGELVRFAGRGLVVRSVAAPEPREVVLASDGFPEDAGFHGTFCFHGARDGAWIVSFPTQIVPTEVIDTDRRGASTITATFTVPYLAHEIAAVDAASGAIRWRLEAGTWQVVCHHDEMAHELPSDRALPAHAIFLAARHHLVVGETSQRRMLSVDLAEGTADWVVDAPPGHTEVFVRGEATYVAVDLEGAPGRRLARFEDGRLTGALVGRAPVTPAMLGPADVWLGDPVSGAWELRAGAGLELRAGRDRGLGGEDGALADAFESTVALYHLPEEAQAR